MRRGGSLAALSPTPVAPVAVHAAHNPILSDGRYYSTDPAPLVVGDTLYILTGRDEAAPGVNDFIMNEWQMLSTRDVASGDWAFYPAMLRPEKVFAWASSARPMPGRSCRGRQASTSTPRCCGIIVRTRIASASAWRCPTRRWGHGWMLIRRGRSSRKPGLCATRCRTSIPRLSWTMTGASTSIGAPSASCAAWSWSAIWSPPRASR
jgi:hypothetical protein